jgi:ABC-type transport system involved in multi-copper enzyme maturation permease subunit
MCTWLTIGTLAIVILAVFLVILLLQPQIISESFSYNSVLIAIAITLGILFIIVCFFCCSSLLCQRIPSVTILPAPSHRKHGSNLEIANY